MPTNILFDKIRRRDGLERGIPLMLLGAQYFGPRRELSLLASKTATFFRRRPLVRVPAKSSSMVTVYSTSSAVTNYRGTGTCSASSSQSFRCRDVHVPTARHTLPGVRRKEWVERDGHH
ncbi:hypothetical protein ACIGEP_01365 [Microbacterium sp. NPDC077663]|uniref:hypothetical protein n=1 Tax=Microbacterium sp. NPDC077663 TaxID=3364189 RepID=UPI0037CC6D3A